MQRTYKITFRHFRVTILAVEKQKPLHIMNVFLCFTLVIPHEKLIFSALYYIVLCGLSGSTILLHIIS
jgi:hypothetical protein